MKLALFILLVLLAIPIVPVVAAILVGIIGAIWYLIFSYPIPALIILFVMFYLAAKNESDSSKKH